MTKNFPIIVERCPAIGLLVGWAPGLPDAHSQGETIGELREALAEALAMLMEDGEPERESEFIGVETWCV